MVDLASHGRLPGLRVFNNTDLGFITRTSNSKSLQQPLNCHPNHREDGKSPGYGFMDRNRLATINSRCPEALCMQLNSLVFSSGIAEHCTRQEKISKLFASIDKERGLLHLSVLSDSMFGSHPRIVDMEAPQSPFVAYPTWCFSDPKSENSLVYPITKLYFDDPFLDWGENGTQIAYTLDRKLNCNSIGSEMKDILSVIADFYVLKDAKKPSERPMVVPYFDWRRRAQSSTDSLKLTTQKAVPLKSNESETGKARQKRKASNKRSSSKEREVYSNSYVYACESLLSIIVDRKQHGKNAILSVKRACPQLPHLLIQFAATTAGAGIAVVLSVACKIGCGKASLCASKALSTTALGLGLVWVSLGIVKLRNTIVCIARSWGKIGGKDNEMMDRLDGNLKDIYLRAVALAAVVLLRFA